MTDRKLEIVLAAKDMTDRAFQSATGSIQKLERQIFSLNGAMAMAAGATAIGYVIKSSLEATTELKRMADMAGVNVEAFQELSYAAGQYNINQDALTDGLKELQLRADEFVVTGAGPAAEAFQRLGYEQGELNRRLSDAPGLLQDVIGRMEGLDQAAKIRISDELFGGTGGEQFVAMINKGADALAGLREEARDLGIVIDQDMVDASDEANRSINALTTVLKLNFQSVIADLAPDIADVTQKMAEWVKQNNDLIQQKVDESIDAISSAITGIVSVYRSLPNEVIGAAGYGIVGRILFGAAGGAVFGLFGAYEAFMDRTAKWIKDNYTAGQAMRAAEGGRLEDWDVGEWETPTTTRNPVMPTVEVVASRPTISTRTSTSGTQIKQTAEWLKEVDRLAKEAQDSLSDMSEPYNAWATMQRQLSDVDSLLEKMRAPLVKLREESLQLYTGITNQDIPSWYDEFYKESTDAIANMNSNGDKIAEKAESTADRMKDAFVGWGSSFSSQLNDVLWNADSTFGDILESFAQMITQMIIQYQIIEPLFKSLGSSSIFSSLSNALFGSAPSASGSAAAAASESGGAGGAPNVRVQIDNKGQATQATSATARYDSAMKEWVIGIVLEARERNTMGFNESFFGSR